MSLIKYAGLETLSAFLNNLKNIFADKEYVDTVVNNINFPVTSVNGQTGDIVIDQAESAQSDWSVNDESDPSYVKNRTHYISTTRVTSLPEQVFETDGYIDLYDVELTGLTPNCECIVTINGTEYRTTAIHNTYNAYEWYVIGNGDLLDEGVGDFSLPFGFFVDKYNENYGQLDGIIGEVTIKIEVFSEIVQKIPEIFLPERVGLAGTGTYSEIFNNLTENKASGDYSHAENFESEASGYSSHAEGIKTKAGGYGSHAEGNDCEASGSYSHAEGWDTLASGAGSHSAGIGTVAKGEGQTVVGKYNIEDAGSLFIVGCGTSASSKINAMTVNAGSVKCLGDVVAQGLSNTETQVSLLDVNDRTTLLESAISELEIKDITTSEIQALFT